MKRILTVLTILALTGGGAFAADKILKGDQFVIQGVNFPKPFKTPSGQILKAGAYDLKVVSDGTEGVLIGLLKGGTRSVSSGESPTSSISAISGPRQETVRRGPGAREKLSPAIRT